MSHKKFLKPKDGRIVRDPQTGVPLSPFGQYVELNRYWRQRFRDGDIDLIDDQKEITKAEKARHAAEEKAKAEEQEAAE